jgi:acetyl-CoA acyltransferase 2
MVAWHRVGKKELLSFLSHFFIFLRFSTLLPSLSLSPCAGCDPSIMGIGPVEAIRGVLRASKLSLDQIDLIEINEAFAAQYLACEKELGLDRKKVNVSGGAIALGHPLGASGARILTHLTHQLVRTGKKYAIGSACIGGGQGIAVLLENVSK